ncbi:hypothetical protein MLD38_039570 [Melastoma candidum]|uniref:Uncharacterized protein n=1 Tax=Melastoma candidum TaxID=119954 RepID=A0ACB9L3P1_9MYRT|nr:hypothetical protein MLD38_039570 [Melastoma candidum]
MEDVVPTRHQPYDRRKDLYEFDSSKAGIKGLVDAGIAKVPRIFLRPLEDVASDCQDAGFQFQIPVVDMGGIDGPGRLEAVLRVRSAAREVGFFQVVNHGIGRDILEGMLDGARAFHEMEGEEKAAYYSREMGRKVKYVSNFDLYLSKYANWRDTLFCLMTLEELDPKELPPVCRDIMVEYSKQVKALGRTLFQLLSEALGLEPNHLANMGCDKGQAILCHYYPSCPEPDLTMGTTRHSDPDFLTVLLQDHIGGLEVLYQDKWVEVLPLPGALVVNIGDLLQLMSNDDFISVEHRVRANQVGPRVSVACFFTQLMDASTTKYGPIRELLSEDNPAKYRDMTVNEFVAEYDSRGLDGKSRSALAHFRLPTI